MAKKTRDGKKFIKAAGATILSLSLLLGVCSAKSNQISNKISSEEQAHIIAEALNCDMSYMRFNYSKDIIRMMHNDEEPIYVGISKEMNQEENQLIQESLDYVFGIVGKINDKYKYKIVDSAEFTKQNLTGKTTIYYIEGPCDFLDRTPSGLIFRTSNLIEKVGKKENNDYYTDYIIKFDREKAKDKEYDDKLYTFIHELLHAFGLDDVYTAGLLKKTDINHKNTIMKSASMGNIITPNDLKCLLSAYSKDFQGQELDEYIEKCKQVCQSYETFYYENRVERLKSYEKDTISLDGQDVSSVFKGKLITLEGEEHELEIVVDIQGDQYVVKFSGGGRESDCIATGDVLEVDGVKVLRDVHFSGNFELNQPEKETIMDLYVVRLETRDMIYDVNNYQSYWGKNLQSQIEK